jgi:hypothetical protein
MQRALKLKGILTDISLYVEEIDNDKDIDTVVNTFDHVNSKGTKLSKSDLACWLQPSQKNIEECL